MPKLEIVLTKGLKHSHTSMMRHKERADALANETEAVRDAIHAARSALAKLEARYQVLAQEQANAADAGRKAERKLSAMISKRLHALGYFPRSAWGRNYGTKEFDVSFVVERPTAYTEVDNPLDY